LRRRSFQQVDEHVSESEILAQLPDSPLGKGVPIRSTISSEISGLAGAHVAASDLTRRSELDRSSIAFVAGRT
jgi:hypothetical protein